MGFCISGGKDQVLDSGVLHIRRKGRGIRDCRILHDKETISRDFSRLYLILIMMFDVDG